MVQDYSFTEQFDILMLHDNCGSITFVLQNRRNLPKPRAARRAPPQRSYIAIAGLWGTQGTGAETGSRGFGELQVQARVLGVNLCYIVYWAALVKKV